MAITGYAAALGWAVSVEAVNKLLVLLATIVVELGAGLAFAIGGMMHRDRPVDVAGSVDGMTARSVAALAHRPVGMVEPVQREQPDTVERAPDTAAGRLLHLLSTNDGHVSGLRSIGDAVGLSKTATASLLAKMQAAGHVAVVSTKVGTRVRLVSGVVAGTVH